MPKRKKKVNMIAEIAAMARAADMTYGEYMAKVLNADKYKIRRKGSVSEK